VNRFAYFSALCRLAPQLLVCIFVFTSCITPKVVEYKSFHKQSFSSRKQPAELQETSTAELLASGYLLIGYMDLRQNIKTCYVDGTCVQHSSAPPQRTDLLIEAAKRGGDVVIILDERSIRERNDRTECTGFYSYTTTVDGKSMVHTNCLGYRTTQGTIEAKVSRALVWRYDPEASVSETNANAIERALLTLETVADKADTASAKAFAANSSFDRSSAPNRPAESQGAKELSQRVSEAIRYNDRDTLAKLTKEGKLKNWSDEEGRSPLMFALSADRMDAAKTLATLDPELARADRSGKSTFAYALMYGDRELIEQLSKAGHNPKAKVPTTNSSYLFYAIINPDTAALDYLLAQGIDIHERDAKNNTALMIAAEFGRIGLLNRLLKMGFAVEQRNNDGQTALMCAARGEQLEIAQLLLKSGANPRSVDNQKRTTLHYAAHGGSQDLIRLLLDKGVALNAEDKNGRTALIEAIAAEHWSATEFLLDRGAALTTAKTEAASICMKLIEKDQLVILRRYVAAFPALKKEFVEDPEWLNYAAQKSGAVIINYLLDLGANVNGATKTSVSPLMTAATAGNVEAVQVLLKRKANPVLRNSHNRTALQVATQAGFDKVVAVMHDLGLKE
jgi:ankyrin repeat protein